jgi:hypothetical protein
MATKKYFLSFHTIFILSENIQWLEEFLIYYKYIGFDHFYLYDNEGSTGGANNTDKQSRWGYEALTTNSEADKEKLEKIMNKYGTMITYVKWQPKNEQNKIVYGQVEGLRHFIQTYGHETTWVAFMDLDEFIFSPSNMDIVDYMKTLPQTVSKVRLSMKVFADRHEILGPYCTQDFRCIEGVSMTYGTACKNIVRTDDFITTTNIHHGYELKQESIDVDKTVLRFNHYNGNNKQLKCLKDVFEVDITLSSIDTGMSRYSNLYGIDSVDIITVPTRQKVLCLGDFDSQVGLGLKTVAKQLGDSYEFVYHNVFHFWLETLVQDVKEADICIFTSKALDVFLWDTFPKSHSIIAKIVILVESQEDMKAVDANLMLSCAIMKASVNNIESKPYYLPSIIDIAQFTLTSRDSYSMNTIGWCGNLANSTQSKDFALAVSDLVQVPISICSSNVPFQRRKEWYETIDVLLLTDSKSQSLQYIYEAIGSGVPVITSSNNGLPAPIAYTQGMAAALLNEFRADPKKLKTLAQEQYTYLITHHSVDAVKSAWTRVFIDIATKSKEYLTTHTTIGKYLYNNLAHRLDRKDHMQKQFAAININPDDILRIDAYNRPGFGHLGCSESHIKALQTALTNEWEWTAIFEDDFTFRRPTEFQIDVQHALQTFRPDILLLAQGTKGLTYEDTSDPNIIRIKRSVTASGYIIHRLYVPVLLKNFQESRNQLEAAGKDATWFCLDQAWAPLQRTDRWFGFKQPIGYQEEGHSDIVGGYVRYNC